MVLSLQVVQPFACRPWAGIHLRSIACATSENMITTGALIMLLYFLSYARCLSSERAADNCSII